MIRWLILAGLMAAGSWLQGQQVGMISPLVGPTIDFLEYERYQLGEPLGWTDLVPDSVRLLPRGEEGYLAFAYFPGGETETKELSKEAFNALRVYLNDRGADLLNRWAELRRRVEAQGRVPVFVLTHTGQVLRGQVTAIDVYQLRLSRPDSTFTLTMEQLAQLELDEVKAETTEPTADVESRFDPVAPLRMRYFFVPTAIPTEKGTSDLRIIGLSTVAYHYGLTKHLSASIGTDLGALALTALLPEVAFGFGSANVRLATKVFDRFYVAGGLLAGGFGAGVGVARAGAIAGWGYGIVTYGNPEYNLSLGIGKIFVKGFGDIRSNLEILPPPLLSFGGTARVFNRIALISENWLLRVNNPNNPFNAANATTGLIMILGGRLIYDDVVYTGGLTQLFFKSPGTRTTPVLPFPLPYFDFSFYFN
jgi:hypothetical protein